MPRKLDAGTKVPMKLRWGLLGPEMEAPGLWSRAPISQKGGSIANGPKLETRNGACPGVRYFAARYLDRLDANTPALGVCKEQGRRKKKCLLFRFLVNSSIPSLYNKTSRSPFPVLFSVGSPSLHTSSRLHRVLHPSFFPGSLWCSNLLTQFPVTL